MIEVFKTNIDCKCNAEKIRIKLSELFPDYKMNFDLEDCDRILRMESENVCISKITSITQELGIQCVLLE